MFKLERMHLPIAFAATTKFQNKDSITHQDGHMTYPSGLPHAFKHTLKVYFILFFTNLSEHWMQNTTKWVTWITTDKLFFLATSILLTLLSSFWPIGYKLLSTRMHIIWRNDTACYITLYGVTISYWILHLSFVFGHQNSTLDFLSKPHVSKIKI